MMVGKNQINVGIGFVTGRKSFKRVFKAHIDNWNASTLVDNQAFALHLFIAYDLEYAKTNVSDYQGFDDAVFNTIDSVHYLGNKAIADEVSYLIKKGIINKTQADLIFGEGYAMKRNIVLYFALKNHMDYLIFLDDDEYPIALLNVEKSIVWKGQEIIATHLKYFFDADMSHGYHCGYVSPIPCLAFNDILKEKDFKLFVEAISNELVNWESVKIKMESGGITYANLDLIKYEKAIKIKEIQGMKFISGANLGFNLNDIDKVLPFYNPPKARGEDAFLSTSIGLCNVIKVPCYAFHDGFGLYESILSGVLPNTLQRVMPNQANVNDRFYKACIGWIRYKPLLIYITDRQNFVAKVVQIKADLKQVLPKISAYFENTDFNNILSEFESYCDNVDIHYQAFADTQAAWIKITSGFKND